MLWKFPSNLGRNKQIIFTESILFKVKLTEMRSDWNYLCSKNILECHPQETRNLRRNDCRILKIFVAGMPLSLCSLGCGMDNRGNGVQLL